MLKPMLDIQITPAENGWIVTTGPFFTGNRAPSYVAESMETLLATVRELAGKTRAPSDPQ